MVDLFKYLRIKKLCISIIIIVIIFSIIYYSSISMQKIIEENLYIKTFIFFLTFLSFFGLFFSITLRKELNNKDVSLLINEKQISNKEIVKQVEKSNKYYNRIRGKGNRV